MRKKIEHMPSLDSLRYMIEYCTRVRVYDSARELDFDLATCEPRNAQLQPKHEERILVLTPIRVAMIVMVFRLTLTAPLVFMRMSLFSWSWKRTITAQPRDMASDWKQQRNGL